jgi:hypothetical protein
MAASMHHLCEKVMVHLQSVYTRRADVSRLQERKKRRGTESDEIYRIYTSIDEIP